MARKWIVLGDKTSHGGTVIEASGSSATGDVMIARVGDKVSCPKRGHGTCAIISGDPKVIIDGKPVDAGMIDGTDNILKMKSLTNAVAFAISLENTGGSTTEAGPKGTIYVMGAV